MYAGRGILQRDSDGRLFIDHIGYAIATVNTKVPMIKVAAQRYPDRHRISLASVQTQIQRHAEQIEKKLLELRGRTEDVRNDETARKGLESVIEKFEWLKQYHNARIQSNPWLKGRLVN